MESPDLRAIARDRTLKPGSGDIAAILYENAYCRLRKPYAAPSSPDEKPRFVAELSLANRGTGHWQTGWTLVDTDGDRCVVAKSGLRFYASRSDVRTRAQNVCRVRIEKEMRALVPGFYCAIGDADGSDDPDVPLLRLYWNLRAGAATKYVALITGRCNGGGLPFRTKVVADPTAYRRADAGVLYIVRTDAAAFAPIVRDVYAEIAPLLHNDVPMFTKRIAPGLAWAEDPGGTHSFGETRCKAIAGGLIAGGDSANEDERYRLMCEALESTRIDIREPYLCGGRSEDYACFSS